MVRPVLIITGASGFIGRHLVELAREDFQIYAVARRSQTEARVPIHPNVTWIQADIASWSTLKAVMHNIKRRGGADYILHLAGYYDFTYRDNPEYNRSNVVGTRHMLELAKWLCVRRFVFASSLAACPFPDPGQSLDEQTPPTAPFHYARSKKAGEEMVEAYSRWFPCSIVRFAAVFSDYCEYAPLYTFLETWLSRRPDARVLGGKGLSAVPFIHVGELCRLLLHLIHRNQELPPLATYCASPDGCTTHRELYELANRYRFGRIRRPILVPRPLAMIGLPLRNLLMRLLGQSPFERFWMVRYTDQQLRVDASATRAALQWEPAPHLVIERRLPFLLEKKRSRPDEWTIRNEATLRRVTVRPNLLIAREIAESKEQLISGVLHDLVNPDNSERFRNYQRMNLAALERLIGILCNLLEAAVRTGDRTLLAVYMEELAPTRFDMGFKAEEVAGALDVLERRVFEVLSASPNLKGMTQATYDYVTFTLQLAADQVDAAYHTWAKGLRFESGRPKEPAAEHAAQTERMADLEQMIRRINVFYRPLGSENGPVADEPVEEETSYAPTPGGND